MIRNPHLAGLAAALFAATPAFAQDAPVTTGSAICDGAEAIWLGETGAASDISATDAPLTAEIAVPARGAAHVAFRVGADQQALRIETVAEGDPQIALSTQDGDLIAENDDNDWSLNSEIETALGPGGYCIAVSSVNGDAIQANVQVSRPDQPRLMNEPTGGSGAIADCTADTPSVAFGEAALDKVLAQGPAELPVGGTEASYLRFHLDAPATLTLRAASDGLDPHVKLFDSGGAMLAENDDADGTDSRLDFIEPLAAGDYCLGVAALSPGAGQITVSATVLDRQQFLNNAYRRGEIAPPHDGSYPMEQIDLNRAKQFTVLHDGRAKWLGLQIDKPTVMIVDAFGSLAGVDSKLVIFAETGAPISDNDDFGGTINARLGPVLLEPGRYAMALTDVNRQDGGGGAVRPIVLTFDRFQRVE